jgi:thioredoxin-related protein
MIAIVLCACAFAVIVQPGPPRPVAATSSDPRVAIRQEKVLHGVLWGMSYEQARERAKREGRPILIFFASVNDANSRMMEYRVFPRSDVVPHLSRFETVTLFTDYAPIHSLTRDQREKIGEENLEFELDLSGGSSAPQVAVVDPLGKLLASHGGYLKSAEFIAFLETAEFGYRSRSGAARYPPWPVWTYGSLLVAAAGLVAIRARIRRENKRKSRDNMASNG